VEERGGRTSRRLNHADLAERSRLWRADGWPYPRPSSASVTSSSIACGWGFSASGEGRLRRPRGSTSRLAVEEHRSLGAVEEPILDGRGVAAPRTRGGVLGHSEVVTRRGKLLARGGGACECIMRESGFYAFGCRTVRTGTFPGVLSRPSNFEG
jgi:hypothetical protein